MKRSVVSHFLIAVAISVLISGPLAVVLSACHPPSAKSTEAVARETARAAVTISADAVSRLDQACSIVVLAAKDKALGEKCDAVYKTARQSLILAAIAVDTWDSAASRQDVTCRVLAVAAGLADIGRELKAKGAAGDTVKAIDDAVSFSRTLGTCGSQTVQSTRDGELGAREVSL